MKAEELEGISEAQRVVPYHWIETAYGDVVLQAGTIYDTDGDVIGRIKEDATDDDVRFYMQVYRKGYEAGLLQGKWDKQREIRNALGL